MFRKLAIRTVELLLVTVLLGITAGCSDDKAKTTSAAQKMLVAKPTTPLPPTGFEFNFSHAVLPPYFAASGLSSVEPFGRWSDSDRVIFRFGSDLPNKFALVILAKAFGPNAGQGIAVRIGAQTREMQLSAEAMTVVRLEFAPNSAADMIEIVVPKPTAVKGGDVRALGIAFSSIKIEPL